jgi:hypothetical protein
MQRGGLELVQPKQSFWSECTPELDVRGFGAMLYEIVTGRKFSPDAAKDTTAAEGDGLEAIRAAAIRLALKCMGYLQTMPSMRQVALRTKLLSLESERIEAHAAPAQNATVPSFLLDPAPEQYDDIAVSRWARVAVADVA